MQTPLTFLIAFIAVLALIGLTAWLVRRFGGDRLSTTANRGRMPRLAVIDHATVDGRRRLVLVRRDNVEHLIMIGGPSDLVVEPNIVRAMPVREQQPRPAGELPARMSGSGDPANWPDSEPRGDALDEPEAIDPLRQSRTAFDDLRRPPAPVFGDVPRADAPGRFDPPPAPRPARAQRPVDAPRATTPPRMPERAPLPPAPPPPPSTASAAPLSPTAEQDLAEMAERLEAALRRTDDAGDARPAPTKPARAGREPTSAVREAAREAARETSWDALREAQRDVQAPVRESASRSDLPARDLLRDLTPSEPAAHAQANDVVDQPALEVAHAATEEATPSAQPARRFENLEDEMASLLGRPKSPT